MSVNSWHIAVVVIDIHLMSVNSWHIAVVVGLVNNRSVGFKSNLIPLGNWTFFCLHAKKLAFYKVLLKMWGTRRSCPWAPTSLSSEYPHKSILVQPFYLHDLYCCKLILVMIIDEILLTLRYININPMIFCCSLFIFKQVLIVL
jgi:hypothetical protein